MCVVPVCGMLWHSKHTHIEEFRSSCWSSKRTCVMMAMTPWQKPRIPKGWGDHIHPPVGKTLVSALLSWHEDSPPTASPNLRPLLMSSQNTSVLGDTTVLPWDLEITPHFQKAAGFPAIIPKPLGNWVNWLSVSQNLDQPSANRICFPDALHQCPEMVSYICW